MVLSDLHGSAQRDQRSAALGQEIDGSRWSRAEIWVRRNLKRTRLEWKRVRPNRFFSASQGIAIVVIDSSGMLSLSSYDRERGVIEIPVKALDAQSMADAVRAIRFAEPWNRRRRAAGLPRIEGLPR